MSTQNEGASQTAKGASPLLRLRCEECGYGVSVRRTPEQCPMCGGSAWLTEGWRPWADLTGDVNPDANAALTRDRDDGVLPGGAA
jgi:hypothetical protein